jgi:hypothetical protein
MGPASGNGNSSKTAERAAAAHNFQAPDFQNGGCILRRVYRIGRPLAERSGEGRVQTAASHAPKQATIVSMGLAIFAMRLLEVMFFAGLAGSAVVVAISFVEDGKELFGKDEK